MTSDTWLAERFEENRGHLQAVAYRMLGSTAEADDAVQEAWLRLSRTDASDVENLAGWLTTVVARISLDVLRSRVSRREEPIDTPAADAVAADVVDPAHEAVLADSVGAALLVVLDTLSPAERLAFVLHDMFEVPFDEIAPIVGRSPVATRKLASRARQRVQGAAPGHDVDASRRQQVVKAFLSASRHGEFGALLALLDPDVVLRADEAAAAMGAPAEIRGRSGVAEMFAGRAQAARPALIDGDPGAIWAHGGETRMVFEFTIHSGRITAIDMVAAPDDISALDIVVLSNA